MRLRTRILLLVALAIVAVSLVATMASGAGTAAPRPGAYVGKTVEGERPVNFALRRGRIRNFVAGINLYCVFGGTFRFDAVVAPRPLPLNGRRFFFDGKDKHGNEILIRGRFISAAKVRGHIEMGAGGCAGVADFRAHHK